MKIVACIALALCAVVFADNSHHAKVDVHDHLATDEQHYDDHGEHNPEYDHEAFAGSEASEFTDLEPEAAKIKLRAMALKVDIDGNGRVTKTELTAWITKQMKRYVEEDADQQWKTHNADQDALMTWEEYKNGTYGFVDEGGDQQEDSFSDILARDRRRFDRADANKDTVLSREEYTHFLHPEEADHMKDLVVDETLDDLDKDKDGLLTLEEYIGEIHPEEDGSEPEWVASEREQFTGQRDVNKDGKLDKEEVAQWILPQDSGHAQEEATHLISMADDDKDEELTIDEIVNHHDVFVGSQATNYGGLLKDEL